MRCARAKCKVLANVCVCAIACRRVKEKKNNMCVCVCVGYGHCQKQHTKYKHVTTVHLDAVPIVGEGEHSCDTSTCFVNFCMLPTIAL